MQRCVSRVNPCCGATSCTTERGKPKCLLWELPSSCTSPRTADKKAASCGEVSFCRYLGCCPLTSEVSVSHSKGIFILPFLSCWSSALFNIQAFASNCAQSVKTRGYHLAIPIWRLLLCTEASAEQISDGRQQMHWWSGVDWKRCSWKCWLLTVAQRGNLCLVLWWQLSCAGNLWIKGETVLI